VDIISVTIAPDGSKAFLSVSDVLRSDYPSSETLSKIVQDAGVVHGLDTAAIEKLTADKLCNVKVEVARATQPTAPENGRLEVLVDLASSGKPRELTGGRVDHREIGYIITVRKNMPIVRRIPPKPGEDGITVLGIPIPASQAQAAALYPGAGTRISEDDPDLLVADKDGAVAIFRDGNAEVLDEKEISGNIDYATGNVFFAGNLIIRGIVCSGFEVQAEGSVSIIGSVEDAVVIAGLNLDIRDGVSGSGHAKLVCGGSLCARHVQNVNVQCGANANIAEDIVHCAVIAEGSVKARSIVGGSICFGSILDVNTIGTAAEAKTVIDMGGMAVLQQQIDDLLKEYSVAIGEREQIKTALYNLVKKEMDNNGNLPDESKQRLEELWQEFAVATEKCRSIRNNIDAIDAKINKSIPPEIRAKVIFPNTLVKAGALEKMIKEKVMNAVVKVEQGVIVVC